MRAVDRAVDVCLSSQVDDRSRPDFPEQPSHRHAVGDIRTHERHSGILERLRQVQQQDPKIYVIPFLLGESALRRQNWDNAAEQLQRGGEAHDAATHDDEIEPVAHARPTL